MIFLEMFVAFAATMAFAVIFNVSRSELIFGGNRIRFVGRLYY